ncbi:MAG: hypothetical protein JSR87_02820 [Proteobacteria bacterium]|nr:hypothetical protein [Pseudomonadota bacterium]MBS0573639.1 hypothetical protein [Pseudomonadota bacterium]
MAYTGFAEEFVQKQPRAGLLRRWFGGLFLSRSAAQAEATVAAPLAGPLPGDHRARGYLADLDIEVGF